MNGFELDLRETSAASTTRELRPVPEEWNRTDASYPLDGCIHQLVADQAARTPDAVALVFGEESLTYRELDERANRLAHHLLRAGVSPETTVGICVARSPAMVVALLAVLKAGGAYLPLDASYPAERLAHMLEDSGARVLVTQAPLLARLPAAGIRVVAIDDDAAAIDAEPGDTPHSAVGPGNAAYVIYTSGSTGRPKGVVVTHANAAALFAGMDDRVGGPTPGCWLAVTRVSFDIHVTELLWTLARGFRVVLSPDLDRTRESGALARQIARNGVTHLQCTPSLATMLISESGVGALAGLERVLLAGEVLPPGVAALIRTVVPDGVMNLYGPTETTVYATSHRVVETDVSVPIGRPLANVRAYVLDDGLRLHPVSVAGELYVGGAGVARGYLGQPALTADRFVPDPFSTRPGARMYRTGDRARWRDDGTLEFLGRVDDQVKIRGFRIELGEVEAALRDHPGVDAAAVAVHPGGNGDDRLVGYVVGRGGLAPAGAELRRELERRLPAYMVPARFVTLDALPLTPSGKLDRHALPAPPARPGGSETPFVAPRTETERRVAGIWAEVLGMPEVGAEDDVASLGANSLAVTQVASRLRARLGADLPLPALFDAGTPAALAALVDSAAASGYREEPQTPAIVRAPAGERLPLSASQERVWFLLQLAPSNLSYNFQAAITFRGALDSAALGAALTEIVRRHEIFRTTFPAEDERPYQQVHAPFEVDLATIDLHALPPEARDTEERRVLREAFAEPFDLTRLPLVRWRLLRRATDEHVLVHMEHHAVHDGWSFNVFLRELLQIYGAFSAGRRSPLAELALQFGDYAYAQRRWLESDQARRQLAFWRERLAGSATVLRLPTDRPRPVEQRFRGAAPRYELPASLYGGLRAVSRGHGVTLFATMLAAFDVLLARWSGQTDLNVGTGIANRRLEETEGLMGMLVNSVVVRTRLEDDPPFAVLARRVHDEVVAAGEHQELPFEALVDALRPDRSLSHNPLFQVMFSFHDSPIPELRLPGLEVEVEPALGNGSAKFDLNVIAIPRAEQRLGKGRPGDGDGITLVWEYSSDLFDPATIIAMLAQYHALLDAVVADFGAAVSRLPLTRPAEREALLAASRASRAFPVTERIPERFARRAAERPDAVALTCDGESLTYGELDARANRLAHHLAPLVAGAECRVAVCLEPSLELVAAILGVLKAGAAYVPLDPAYPAKRIAWMVEDSGASVLVTRADLFDGPAGEGVRVVRLDADAAAISARPADAPRVHGSPASPAYVIYTSGSTGKPKGVEVTHANVIRLFDATDDRFGFDAGDVWTLFHSCAFDFSVWEIWGALLYGARLVVVPFLTTRSPDDFHRLLVEEGVTVLNQTPTAFRQLVQADLASGTEPRALALKWVILGGEALDPRSLRPWTDRHGYRHPRLVNMYGITETTVHATWRLVTANDVERGGSPIGAALPDLSLHLLDRHLKPVPAGVPGEVFVGGAGVARGYLDRPGLTAERFVGDPFSDDPEARLYRSGDLARRRADGDLEYLGRTDQQVKVRGFRIETGEVEFALSRHPAVADAVVVARDDGAGEARLVAYVIAASGGAPSAAELRTYLLASLPAHMVPAAFVAVDNLPLTGNGKLDHATLPAPQWANAAVAPDTYVEPRTPVELELSRAWAEVLGVERIGIDDNYFALGGDSLRSVRIAAAARRRGLALSIPQLFVHQTIRALAAAIEAGGAGREHAAATPRPAGEPPPRGEARALRWGRAVNVARRKEGKVRRAAARRTGREPVPPPVEPVGRAGPLPLSFAQERLWFLDRLQPGSAFYNVPVTVRLTGALDAAALERALGGIIRRHEVLRTTFHEEDGSPAQRVAPFAGFTLAVEDLSGLDQPEKEADRRAAEEAARPFDLASGPLLRLVLLRLGEEEHLLSMCMHHIVSDEWSIRVLLSELSALYAAYAEGGEPHLPELRVQYADYAAWERRHLGSADALERRIAWWKERLAGAPAELALPTDRPRPALQSFRGARVHGRLGRGLRERLEALGRSEGASLYMVVLAAFQLLLGRYTGNEDVVVGSAVTGAARLELEELIGLFVNTVVLRADLSGDPGFRELLRRVRDVAAEAYEHQDVPFERLVAELRPERKLSHSPLFQVAFVQEEARSLQLALPGLTLRRVHAESGTSKFDLTLSISGSGDGLQTLLVYSTDLFGRRTAERMLAQLERVLEQVAADPDAPLSRLELAGAEERRQVIEAWNQTRRAYPRDVCIHERFAAWAAEHPDTTALVWGDVRMSYAELDARANGWAHLLRRHGVETETCVGVLLERGAELIVSLLAILKAGGCYVPLDPAYPAERLRLMLADAGARVVVTRRALAESLDPRDLAVVCLDERTDAAAVVDAPRPHVAAENLAYVVYTSGSTGLPKGVMASHRNVVQLVVETDFVQLRPGDRVAQASSASFDALTFELWGALLNGATLVGIDRDVLLSPPGLREALRAQSITTLYQTTALLNLLSREQPDVFAPLREVLFGGEAADAESVRRILATGGPRRLLHVYGPTETTAWCSYARVEKVDDDAPTVSVGRPTGNQRIYLLDSALRPVPIGVPGEAYVGGDGVARGYLNRPALTAERFVPDPFTDGPGARMYRTGDRLRWTAEGALEFVGRLDGQVKIRGHRVEPGEVEAALAAHPWVDEARVVAREDQPGERRLVAYLVGEVSAHEVRGFLGASLPDYMIPSAFVVLDRLPLTASGKLDRAALPVPERVGTGHPPVAPATPVEQALAAIWAEVLEVERVGATDNFFELGGHSLLATRVVSRIGAVLSVELPLRALFERPTVAALALAVEEARRAGLPALPPIVPLGRDRPLPLSFSQERLWFLDRLEPGSASYNIPAALYLAGPLDVPALEHALGEVVRRHEVLRTTFRETDEGPVQAIEPFGGFALPVEDVSSLDAEAREAAVRRRAAEDAERPFHLSAGPLFRASLLRLGDEEHVLLLSMHHIVSDGWSMGLLFRETSLLYRACRDGDASPLADLPVQYADYAGWQRRRLRGEVLERQLAYWRERLAGAPELLELPTDRPRPAVRSDQGSHVPVALPRAIREGLEAAGREEGATLFMVLLAAFQVLLARYGGDDLVVGSSIAGRTRHEADALIGFFVNMLALRVDLSGDPSFRQVLGRVREATVGAYEHQDLPFEKLVAELRPRRSPSHAPVFQVTFALEPGDAPSLALPGLATRDLGAGPTSAKFDLMLFLAVEAGGLRGRLTYSVDLFERATVERMARRLERVLEQVAGNPDARLSGMDLFEAGERRRVVEEWNRTGSAYPAEPCAHRRFEAQAARTPDAVAVEFRAEALTYRELNERANRLAHHLRRLGVAPEVRVGLCLERSLETAVSILAVLKAGGAYVPLDPGYPAERLERMLADSGSRVLLTRARLLDRIPVPSGVTVVGVDGEPPEVAGESAENPEGGATPRSLAYVIYTSGSTGAPKGVAVEHRALGSYLAWAVRLYPASRTAVHSSLSFDLTVTSLFVPLLCGGCVELVEEEAAVEELAGRLERGGGYAMLKLTPAHLDVLAEQLRERRLSGGVECLVVGGEPLLGEHFDAWRPQFPDMVVVNEYGPTEAVVGCCVHVQALRDLPPGRVPIGRPVAGTRLYVLDAGLRPVPVGMAGELYIGGAQLARGYLGRPGQTAERFGPDPFGEPGTRLYRTGDGARWRADGTLEYLGRLDEQVKIRGYRVEPGEVEAVLREHPSVRNCAVVALEDVSGDRRLAAYVVGPVGPATLREHLRRRLPEHMVPAAIVTLDRLPLTPNGKLDRRALPAPTPAAAEDGRDAAPRTPVEEVLAGIWAEVLGRGEVGIHENFFDLGGHSLLATRVVSRIRAVLSVELRLRMLFDAPTVAQLAAAVEALLHARHPVLPPITPAVHDRPPPLSFGQERLWFLDRLNPASAVYNMPSALRLTGALVAPALERSLGEIVRRHDVLRTTFVREGGEPVQVIAPFTGFTLEVETLSGLAGEAREAAVRERVAEHATLPFDLAAGPLFRAALLRLGEQDHVLLICIHHAVCDGWSRGVLFRELSALYAGFLEGDAPALPALPALPVQYADYAVWQREQLRSGALRSPLAWWMEQLADAPAQLELSTDHPRPTLRTHRGGSVELVLPPALLGGLRALGRSEGATLFMALLGAFQALLAKYGGSTDVVVGTPVAGRTRQEVEGLIGFFVNTLVLRTGLGGNPSFREVLRRVRAATLGAYEHQEVPFERLVAELRPERNLGQTPLFQVMFALEETGIEAPRLPGVHAEPVVAELGLTKFDLTLAATPDAGGLRCRLGYATELFERETIERMGGHLARLLERLVDDPERPLSHLGLLGDDERARVLDAWNDTGAAYPVDRCIHHLFEAQAARTPQSVAAVCEYDSITYAALNERANRLAHHLVALGVEPEARVGICLARGLELLVALLAVLKAGGAYVPLDPAYPAERLAFTLDDATARVLVTQASLRALLPPMEGACVVSVDEDAAAIAARPSENPTATVEPRNLAYLIYTSGSTGRPKGVAIEHRSTVAFLAWASTLCPDDELAGMLASTSVCFDLSVYELFLPITRGGRVIVVDDALAFPRSATAGQVRIVNTVPSAAASLLATGGIPGGVRTVNLAGEPLRAELVDALYARGVERVHDLYGPSEDTTYSTFALRRAGGPVTIGKPVANTRAYVLDPDLQPVPDGVLGELYLGGLGLARGYLGRPALTAERFVPDPFGVAGGRLYRTGDQVRRRADGTLELRGRLDHQVKIRGFRVELGEVEAALRGHPAVRDCVVLAHEPVPGDRRLVAYVVGQVEAGALRDHLRIHLPAYMLPGAIVPLAALPLTPSGKVDRAALPAPAGAAAVRRAEPETMLESRLEALWRELLGVDRVGAEDNFFDLGGHSILLAQMQARLAGDLGREVSVVELFQFPTVRSLAARLREVGETAHAADGDLPPLPRPGRAAGGARRGGRLRRIRARAAGRMGVDVAVVGMAGRFPGADDVHAFWRNLRDGIESISRLGRDELLAAGADADLLDTLGFVAAGGVLRGGDEFDATLFGLSPRDAEVLNPQHRVLLECAWTALEQAGYDPARAGFPVGVFAGASTNTYVLNLQASPEVTRSVGTLRIALGNERDHLAAGIAYRLGLRGPALAIQTACSTSLVAVHLACRSLAAGECGMALAGGVSVRLPLRAGYVYSPDGILSPDGRCRAFDANARGTVSGSGAGMVALRRLEDAIADGDTIHAVIRGSAINNDGAEKVGYTAPSVTGQARVLRAALAAARVSPASVQYLETHGSGTPLGDAIEVRAASLVLAGAGAEHRWAIGSVKPNVGHLDVAAGVTGLIKTVLALKHRQLPPSLNCAVPNPEIEASGGRVYVNTRLRPWERNGTPRRAGVSSFGIGGTNAHVVLEEAPPLPPPGPSRAFQLLTVSARTPSALAAAAANLADYIEGEAPSLADVAYTLQMGRREMEYRLAVPCADAADGAARLRAAPGRPGAPVAAAARPVAFMFPGLGMHSPGMARELYEAEPTFRVVVDECCELLRPILGIDLRLVLYPPGAPPANGDDGGWDLPGILGRRPDGGAPRPPLEDTRLAQPAVFVTEYALARLWMSWGVKPRAMIGHSLGEYVAACVAGVMRLDDALGLVALRARLIDALPPGAMLAVALGEAPLREILTPELDVAAVNTPESCVVSGPVDAIEAFEALLEARGTVNRRLPTSHAFHSRAMAEIAAELERLVGGLRLGEPEIPLLSGMTGTWIRDEDARSPAYWARHLCQPVRFADGIDTLREEPGWVLLEVGPGQMLGAWAMRHPADGALRDHAVFSSLPHPHNRISDLRFLLEALGGLWTAGAKVDWAAFSRGERRRRVVLPGYPFERRRFWVDPPERGVVTEPVSGTPSATGESRARAYRPDGGDGESGAVAMRPAAGSSRRDVILHHLKAIASESSGVPEEYIETDGSLFQAGFDSLLLMSWMRAVEKRFGIRLSPRELLEEDATLASLAEQIERTLPPDAVVPDLRPGPLPREEREGPGAGADAAAPLRNPPELLSPDSAESVLERVIAQQIMIMEQEIELLRTQGEQRLALMAQQIAALRGAAATLVPVTTLSGDRGNRGGRDEP